MFKPKYWGGNAGYLLSRRRKWPVMPSELACFPRAIPFVFPSLKKEISMWKLDLRTVSGVIVLLLGTMGLSPSLLAQPFIFTEQGPGPIINGQDEGLTSP